MYEFNTTYETIDTRKTVKAVASDTHLAIRTPDNIWHCHSLEKQSHLWSKELKMSIDDDGEIIGPYLHFWKATFMLENGNNVGILGKNLYLRSKLKMTTEKYDILTYPCRIRRKSDGKEIFEFSESKYIISILLYSIYICITVSHKKHSLLLCNLNIAFNHLNEYFNRKV